MKEIWKEINDYNGQYFISNLGNIKSLKSSKYLKPQNDGSGYLFVMLSKNSIRKNYKIHRLVAEHFIENPNNYKVVNHIDGNKLNNKVDNLEWCTHGENNQHAWKMNLNKNTHKQRAQASKWCRNNREKLQKGLDKKSMKVLCVNTGEVFNTVREASNKLGVSKNQIYRVISGDRNSVFGYKFKKLLELSHEKN